MNMHINLLIFFFILDICILVRLRIVVEMDYYTFMMQEINIILLYILYYSQHNQHPCTCKSCSVRKYSSIYYNYSNVVLMVHVSFI